MPGGQPISSRAISKIRNGESGHRYAADQLVAAGARARHFGEEGASWLPHLERISFLRSQRHPGNYVYLFALTKAARIAERGVPNLPYPILDRSAPTVGVTALPLLARAA